MSHCKMCSTYGLRTRCVLTSLEKTPGHTVYAQQHKRVSLEPQIADVCLTFLVYKGTKMKLGSVCRARQMQLDGTSSYSGFGVHFRRRVRVFGIARLTVK